MSVTRAIFAGISQGILNFGQALDPASSLNAIKKAARPIAPRLERIRRERVFAATRLTTIRHKKRA